MSKKITIFLNGAGSNEGDLSGKLQFRRCTDIELTPTYGGITLLSFTYRGKGGTGKPVKASFNLNNICGHGIEEEDRQCTVPQ